MAEAKLTQGKLNTFLFLFFFEGGREDKGKFERVCRSVFFTLGHTLFQDFALILRVARPKLPCLH